MAEGETAPMTERTVARRPDPVAIWLFVIAGMIFFMVVLGGVTRLTESGLSMVDWRPVTGWLPPIGEAEWQKVFDAYRQSPQYRDINAGMTLAAFKEIFWLEYLHRLFGRIIGLAFGLPFVWFLATGRLQGDLKVKCGALFVLGGLQGVLGWWMVKSGLIDNPAVSQYRLAAHLGLALVIYLAVLWTAIGIVAPRGDKGQGSHRRWAGAMLGLAFVTVMSGALVAGLDAGFLFNTFPLMEGRLWPDESFHMEPFWLNFFEDRGAVQFDHRVLAMTTLAAAVAYWVRVRRAPEAAMRRAGGLLLAAVGLQVALGIATLVLVVPVPLAALHQAGAVLVLTAALWAWDRAGR